MEEQSWRYSFKRLVLTLQVFDDPPETIAVGGNEHPLAIFDLGDDLLVPEGQSASDGVL